MAKRLQAMNVNGYENGFSLSILPERLSEPLNRKKPTIYFVNSMSDLFHEGIDDNFIGQIFSVINQAKQHHNLLKQYFINHLVIIERTTKNWSANNCTLISQSC
jgi:protein gp37